MLRVWVWVRARAPMLFTRLRYSEPREESVTSETEGENGGQRVGCSGQPPTHHTPLWSKTWVRVKRNTSFFQSAWWIKKFKGNSKAKKNLWWPKKKSYSPIVLWEEYPNCWLETGMCGREPEEMWAGCWVVLVTLAKADSGAQDRSQINRRTWLIFMGTLPHTPHVKMPTRYSLWWWSW